ncbi:MAG: redox-sensing transcriptional repressor Rex [Thermoguttaceae bacterium]
MSSPNNKNFPLPSIQRLPVYLRFLKELRDKGEMSVSCTQIADEFGQLSVQVRKDLSITGIIGRPKVGYKIAELIESIEEFLGWNRRTVACLVGAGSLGSAILGYSGFSQLGLDIVCAFDADKSKIGKKIHERPVYDFSKLADFAEEFKFEMGIITCPAPAAQDVANALVASGVRAIWNYTPVRLELPDNVICEDVKLSASLAVLSSRMRG